MIDRSVVLAVVFIMGGTLLVLVFGIVWVSIVKGSLSEVIGTLAGGALGYLGGLLTNVARKQSEEKPPAPTSPVDRLPLVPAAASAVAEVNTTPAV